MEVHWTQITPTMHDPKAEGFWSDRSGASWRVEFAFRLIEGRYEATRIVIESITQQAVSASLIRSVPVAQLAAEARVLLMDARSKLEDEVWHGLPDVARGVFNLDGSRVLESHRRQWEDPHRVGRRGNPPGHYATVAEVYADAYLRGDRPTQAVADKFIVSKATAAKWVAKARDLGFLGSTERGRAGGVVVHNHENEE